MKIKNAKLSLFILAGLLVLSFSVFAAAQEKNTSQNIFLDSDQDGLSDAEEKTYGTDPHKADTDGDGYSDGVEVKSGYNPLRPAPGDRIIPEPIKATISNNQDSVKKVNLTSQLAKKITDLANNIDPNTQTISLDEIKTIAQDSVNQSVTTDDLPEVAADEIKIKKQNFTGLSETKKKELMKEDFTNYIVAIFYIMSSNSPKPLTSSDDINGAMASTTQEISNALASQDTSSLSTLGETGTKILEQLKDIEVPEDLVALHTKALRFAKYAVNVPDMIAPDSADPLAQLTNFSKLQAFIETLMSFNSDMQSKFSEYGIAYDDIVKGKIKSLGIDPPTLTESTDSTSETTSPLLSFIDDVAIGPVVNDTVLAIWGNATIKKWDYASDANCSTDKDDYSKSNSDSMNQIDESHNEKYICLYGEDADGNKNTLASINVINVDLTATSVAN